ncbi:hypothetical protein HDU98_005804 [Podochytrium sp. JEL0797]|nr:hypothetical protein HDU98_005804 [Podochytrium sp. JEL0797]
MTPETINLAVSNTVASVTIMTSIVGIVQTIRILGMDSANAKLLLVGNFWSLVFQTSLLVAAYATAEDCYISSVVFNISGHAFLVSFGIFLLYKTWIVCRQSNSFLYLSVLLIAIRVAWASYDSVASQGSWFNNTCEYNQNEVSGYGYVAADITIDFTCTFCTLAQGSKYVSHTSVMKRLIAMLVFENVLRSCIVLVVNAVTLTILLTVAGPWVLVVDSVYLACYCAVLNSELYWVKRRSALAQQEHDEDDAGA